MGELDEVEGDLISECYAGKRNEGMDWMFGWGRAKGNPPGMKTSFQP